MTKIVIKSEKTNANSQWLMTDSSDRRNFTTEESVIIDKYYEFVESLIGFQSIDTIIEDNTKTTTITFDSLDNANFANQFLSNTHYRAIQSTNFHNLLQSKAIELGIINTPSRPEVQE